MGYPPQEPNPDGGDALQEAVSQLGLHPRAVGPAHRRTVVLTAARETPWAHRGAMVLMSARVLRMLLARARLLRARPRNRRGRPRIDIRV